MYLEISIRNAQHSGSAGYYNHPKFFVTFNGYDHDNSASWAVHIKSLASDLASLSFGVLRQECFRNMGMSSLSYSCLGESPR